MKTPDDVIDDVDYTKPFRFLIGTSTVEYIFSDEAENTATCEITVTVKGRKTQCGASIIKIELILIR